MNKPLTALLGSGEYMPVMNEIDQYLLEHSSAKGKRPKVVCLPTAAGQEGEASWSGWNNLGIKHFEALNADVVGLPIINQETANDPQFVETIEQADLIYFSGGSPRHLFESLNGSLAWQAAEKAWARGAVYAGCSAGAMILGENMPDFRNLGLRHKTAFNWLPNATILPHFDQLSRWRGIATPLIQTWLGKNDFVLGIDEETAVIGTPGQTWQVMGKQAAYIITRHNINTFKAGETFNLP